MATSSVKKAEALPVKVMGLNSGTSIDVVDCVRCHCTQESPDAPLHLKILEYEGAASEHHEARLRIICDNKTTPRELSQINVKLGDDFADFVLDSPPRFHHG